MDDNFLAGVLVSSIAALAALLITVVLAVINGGVQ